MKRKRGRKAFLRGGRTRDSGDRVLIVCEGEKTEPDYFNEIRKRFRLQRSLITVISAGEPASIVKVADRMERDAEREGNPIDSVWLVFDDDGRPQIADILKQQSSRKKRSVAFSNPCFEIWCLLHFEERPGPFSDSQAVKKHLTSHIPEYEEGTPVYRHLLPNQEHAMVRAQRQRQFHKEVGNPETSNPSTSVDRLVRFLIESGSLNGTR